MNIAWNAVGNHLWQSTLFAAAAWLITIALRGNSAQARYRVWLAASLKFLVPFSLLVAMGGKIGTLPAPPAMRAMAPAAVSPLKHSIGTALAEPIDWTVDTAAANGRWIAILLASVWLCGFLAVRWRWHTRWGRVKAQLRDLEFPSEGREVEALRSLESNARLALSPRWMEPAVVGVMRPLLVLPSGIASKLSDAQLRAILAHEVSHLRRRDNLGATLHTFVEAVFWFHPLVWWLGARLVEERELACDEEVLRLGSEPAAYARGILRVCEYCLESPLACVAGVTGADLKKRIEQIATHRIVRGLSLGRKLLLVAAGGATILLPLAIGIAQSQAFEVATIKPTHYEGGPLRVTGAMEPNGINFQNQTLRGMIQRAYGVKPYQVTGPAWINTERYTVIAKAAGRAKEEQILLMLQTLLAERFKLVFHREQKEMPVYALVVGKNGPRMKENKSEGATEIGGGTGEGMKFERASMGQLAGALRQSVDLPVIDQTGLKGLYDFDLTFSREAAATDPNGAPSIFTALQEQLGLKLESKRGAVDMIVVDKAEKAPIEN